MQDNNLHTNYNNDQNYPEPNIHVEEAWKKMKEMLNILPSETGKGKNQLKNFTDRKLLLYAILGIVLLLTIDYYFFINKPADNPAAITYFSGNNPKKETLVNGFTAFLDKKTFIAEQVSDNRNTTLSGINGAVYFEGIPNKPGTVEIIMGSLKVIPDDSDIYVSFDSSSNLASVHVQHGKVTLEVEKNRITLSEGESIEYNSKMKLFGKKEKVNINLFGYATKVFDFTDTPLKEVADCIGKSYDVDIQIARKELYNCSITTRFDNKSLKEIMDIIMYTLSLEYTIANNNKLILITGKGCD